MKFIDEISLFVKAGNGGRGCVSFRHDYRNPKAGPDGGNGGNGGSVYFQGNEQLNSFFSLQGKKNWVATNGKNGQSKLKSGKNGDDLYIQVPLGTVIKWNRGEDSFLSSFLDKQNDLILGEILFPQQTLIIAKGGKGGWGNHAFANSVNRSPRYSQSGLTGENFHLQLELKILADVGLLGLPNVGKSTLVNSLTNTKLKTANFPFTTLNPQLGVLTKDEEKLIIADLPGIIEGASQGKGLGLQFLRHIMRCSLIIYVLDANNSESEKDLFILEKELESNVTVTNQGKEKIIIWNKIDLLSLEEQKKLYEKTKNELSKEKHFFLSALKKVNLDSLVEEIFELIKKNKKKITFSPLHKIYDFTVPLDLQVNLLKPHCWKLTGSTVENLLQKNKSGEKLVEELKKLPLNEYFQRKGIKNNDTIIIEKQEFFWKYE